MVTQHLRVRLVLGFAFCCVTQLPPTWPAKQNPSDQSYQPAQDEPDCPDLPVFPVLPMSVVESCQRGDSVGVTLPLKPDAQGLAQEKRVRGAYEFRGYRIPESEREHAFDSLMNLLPMKGFVVKYSIKPATITARKGDTWMLINVSGESYDVSVVVVPQESWTPVKTAEEIAREMKAHGQVDIYGIEFSSKDQSSQAIVEEQSDILSEILKYLKANSDVSIIIESHKISTIGAPEDDLEITRERANAVMDWLIAHGVDRSRVQPRPRGRDNPITDNESPAGAKRNERIVLVKAHS
jgi:outer membrane protein OmpA-like peptidoglycan-associated protein